MFHLLVSYGGWQDGGGTISTSRVYIRANDPVQREFLNDRGALDLSKIREIPALLVSETNGAGSQLARVAYINGISQNTQETEIQYVVDNSVRPISNKNLENFSTQLGLGRFGLSHTCWRIVDVDLFKLLLTNVQRSFLSPTAFAIHGIEMEDDLVSVMMPFSAEFNAVHTTLIDAVVSTGLRCLRADNIWEHQTVIQDIVNLIVKARIVICDCSGRNPNVFYEAGIAHALGKEVILITQNEGDIPFDLRHFRYIRYLGNDQGLAELSSAVQSRIRTLVSQ